MFKTIIKTAFISSLFSPLAVKAQESINLNTINNVNNINRIINSGNRDSYDDNIGIDNKHKGDDYNNELYTVEDSGVTDIEKNAEGISTNIETERNIGGDVGGNNKVGEGLGSEIGKNGSDTEQNYNDNSSNSGEKHNNNGGYGGGDNNNSNNNDNNNHTGNQNNNDNGSSNKEQEKNNSQNNQNDSTTGDNKNDDSGDDDKPDPNQEKPNPDDEHDKNASPHPDGEGGDNEMNQRGIINPDWITKGAATKIREGGKKAAEKLNAAGLVNPDHVMGNDPKFDHTAGDENGTIDPNQTGSKKIGNTPDAGKLDGRQFDNGKLKGKGFGNPNSINGTGNKN